MLVVAVGSWVNVGICAALVDGLFVSVSVTGLLGVLVASVCVETPGKMVSVPEIVIGAPEFEASAALDVGRALVSASVTGPAVLVASAGVEDPGKMVSVPEIIIGAPEFEASAALDVGGALVSVVLVASVCVGVPAKMVSVPEIVIGAPGSLEVGTVGKLSVLVLVGEVAGTSVTGVDDGSSEETAWLGVDSVIWPVVVSVDVPVGAAVGRGSLASEDEAVRGSVEVPVDVASPAVVSTPVTVGVVDVPEPSDTRFEKSANAIHRGY